MLLRGLVIKSTGNWYQVMSGTETYPCRIIGKFRLNDKVLTNPVAVGDEVDFELERESDHEKKGVIKKYCPGKTISPGNHPGKNIIFTSLLPMWIRQSS